MVWILSIHLGLESGGLVTWDFGYCPRWNRLGNPVISWELLRHSASGTLGIALSRHVRTNLGCYGTFVTRAFGYYTTWDKIELPRMSTSKTLLVYMFFFSWNLSKHLPAQAMDPGLNSWWLPAFHFPLSHPHNINPITFFISFRLSPESIFLDMALSSKMQERAENFGITFRLDICGLYKVCQVV